jgi:transcriptional regulator
MAKMSGDATSRMTRMILPLAMTIETVESTVKLNQNKTPEQRAGAITGIAANPIGLDAAQIAAWMGS